MAPIPYRDVPGDLYRAAEVRAIDQYAMTVLGIPGIDLMERAGAAAFKALHERWPEARTLSVVCGNGNNGGDGYIVARLAHQQGWDVRAYPAASPDALKGDAMLAYRRFREAGGAVLDFIPQDFEGAEILADALLGTGLDREVTGPYADIIQAINRYRARQTLHRAVVALDIPSGLNADTGMSMGHAVRADMTIAFVGLKRGLFTGEGLEYAGDIRFDDLGIGISSPPGIRPSARLLSWPEALLPPRSRAAHKGLFGHALVIGGEHGYSGAARLAAEAAARVGAGLVSVATRAAHAGLIPLTRPELMCHGVESGPALQALAERASVIAIGPGLGRNDWGREMFRQALDTRLPLIVDADALNLLAEQPLRRDDWILTPHPGEAARLLGVASNDIQRDRFAAIEALQARYGGHIVLKGSGTLILGGDSVVSVCTRGNPGMASGGMGDVLTGVIAGLATQKLPLPEAAAYGVWLHGAAGDLAAAEGERGLLASDLMRPLRELVNRPPFA